MGTFYDRDHHSGMRIGSHLWKGAPLDAELAAKAQEKTQNASPAPQPPAPAESKPTSTPDAP